MKNCNFYIKLEAFLVNFIYYGFTGCDFINFVIQVRLLTGIGRYTEMNYIFQILKDNEQFEYLLGKVQGEVSITMFLSFLLYLRKNKKADNSKNTL